MGAFPLYTDNMFKDKAVLDSPRAVWMLDDSSPYQDHSGRGAVATGTNDSGAAVVSGAAFSSIFHSAKTGSFTPGVFLQGRELQPFTLEAWVYPIEKTSVGLQSILSHGSTGDGITINDNTVRFSTVYTTAGTSECTYTPDTYMRMHIVAVHTSEHNQLFVNGALVSEADITDDQYLDTFSSSATALTAGTTTSTQQFAMNGVCAYSRALTQDEISAHYAEGVRTVPSSDIATAFGGTVIGASPVDVALSDTWDTDEDWADGYLQSAAVQNNTLFAMTDDTDLTLAGTWLGSFPLDYGENTSLYAVVVSYTAVNATVDVSLDGTTWVSAPNMERTTVFTSGFDPTDEQLLIRVNLSSGKTESYVVEMTVTAMVTTSAPNFSTRDMTATGDVAYRSLNEPHAMRDDVGIRLNGTLTIGPDTADDAPTQRTVEAWVKRLDSTAFTISTSGTQYRQGVASSTAPPVGEWVLVHVVASADFTTSIVFGGNVVLSQIATYETALTAAQIAKIYKSYTGFPTLRVDASDTFGVQSIVGGANIYAFDWSIQPVGG